VSNQLTTPEQEAQSCIYNRASLACHMMTTCKALNIGRSNVQAVPSCKLPAKQQLAPWQTERSQVQLPLACR
jgi:hypothetical protein